jgi:pSer/pThr/pTyr-binding forkhead associated (FHA) protein
VIEIKEENKGKLIGLKLICQSTSEEITIKDESTILGREYVGAELFSKIIVDQKQVISRKHCSILRSGETYVLKDEGSTNGTYYGVNKIDCTKEAQAIEHNSILFLGREAFLVQFIYEEVKQSNTGGYDSSNRKPDKPVKYRCNEGCGHESDTKFDICPKCMTSNSMVEINAMDN